MVQQVVESNAAEETAGVESTIFERKQKLRRKEHARI